MDKEGKINLLFIIIFLGLLVALMVYPVVAPGDYSVQGSDDVVLNISGDSNVGATSGNQTINEDVPYTFNFTINHINNTGAGLNLTQVNITIPENFTYTTGTNKTGNITDSIGGWNHIQFNNLTARVLTFNGTNATSTVIFSNGSATGGVPGKNGTFLMINLTAGTPGKYNITVRLGFNATIGVFNETNISVIVNDTTAPYSVNASSNNSDFGLNRSYANVSGTLVVNISAIDNGNLTAGAREYDVQAVNVSFYNGSGLFNGSFLLTNVTRTFWNISINTSTINDGVYNISVYVNDTLNNVVATNVSLNVRIDNTAPTSNPSCSPTTVQTGDTFPCSCSGSDATSGINSSATSGSSNSPEGTGTPSSTGSFTFSCKVVDMSKNSKTNSVTYIVEQVSGGVGGGGAGAVGAVERFYTKTVPVISQDLSQIEGGISQVLGEKDRVKVLINNETHFVGVRDVKNDSVIIEIASDPVQVELKVGEDTEVDVTDDNIADVYVKLNAITNGKADLTIKYIQEAVVPEEEVTPPTEEEAAREVNLVWLWIVIAVVVIAIVVYWIWRRNK